MKKYDVYGMGNALVDIEFSVKDNFFSDNEIEKGLMTLVDEERQNSIMKHFNGNGGGKVACGGSAANTVIGLSYFGGKAFYTCKVADDEHGHFYMDDMHSAGVETNIKGVMEEGVTGKCLVMVSDDAERTMNTYLGASETLSEKDLDLEAIKASEYLYIEGYLVTSDIARVAVKKAYVTALENGVKVALTFSDPAMVKYFKDGMKEMVGDGVDLLFCNAEEAMLWTDCDNVNEAAEKLKRTATNFCMTLGSEGALLYDGKEYINIAPNKVTAVDTTGAGDLFAGSFLYGITNGMTFQQAGDLASAASSQVVSKFGPRLTKEEHDELAKK
ncbi:MAG: adenosine kinase [Denitrovibrio sp.]|nr:MAG: adenosine kinase [Denitrovibrio sp.]